MFGLPSATAGTVGRSRPAGWVPLPIPTSHSQAAAVAALPPPPPQLTTLAPHAGGPAGTVGRSRPVGWVPLPIPISHSQAAAVASLPPPLPPRPLLGGLKPAQIAAVPIAPSPLAHSTSTTSSGVVGHKRQHQALSPAYNPFDADVVDGAFDQFAVAELEHAHDDLDPGDFEPVAFIDLGASDDELDIGFPDDPAAPHWAHGAGAPPNLDATGADEPGNVAPHGLAPLAPPPPPPAVVGGLSPEELARRDWAPYCIQEPVKLTVCDFFSEFDSSRLKLNHVRLFACSMTATKQ